MAEMPRAQENQLKMLAGQFRRLQQKLTVVYEKTDHQALQHGLLALQIAEHTVAETLKRRGLAGEIGHRRNYKAHRQARQWYKIVRGIKNQANKFRNSHPSEDLETALKALQIAQSSLEEVVERYE
jgi:hypothetical protein